MKKWIVIATILMVGSYSFAQKIKVRRVKGNQAVIEYTGAPLRPGQVYELTQDEYSENNFISTGNRKYQVSLGFSLSNSKSDAAGAVSETDIAINTSFGWNKGHYEFGPTFYYSSDGVADKTINTIRVGAFGDYNLISNASGEPFIYGLGGTFAMGQQDGGGLGTIGLTNFFVGPFAKWFPNGGDVGLRIDGGYLYQKQNGGNTDATVNGIGLVGALLAYF